MSKPSTSTGLGEPRAPSRKNADNIIGDMSGKTEVNRESSGETPSAEVKQGQGSDDVKETNSKPEDKKDQALAQKKAFDDRFKKRGKRPLPPRDAGEEDTDNKKPKRELTAYEKEVQKYESRILKDQGSGVRSVMK
ncbi:hypothetical protein QFC20_000065 [Naganishia adeliensis]|uniref:Uncharacterized protein n=1 Tax=Naganishia adeliensis TaxID=92952 RepID=A0ACC2X2A7_9TREE|nr:hypothetical protein QFC20_000065 [Naganishia adeliensis]